MTHKYSEAFHRLFPRNCPIIEETIDGEMVGTCAFYSPDCKCPRHGDFRNLTNHSSRPATCAESKGDSDNPQAA